MTYKKTPSYALAFYALAASVALMPWPATAQTAPFSDPTEVGVPTSLPQAQHAGGVTYITGGIGDEERASLLQSKKNYNLYITSASSSGDFEGDTQLVIRNAKGDVLLSAASGPLFYAKLPAGRYVVEAHSGSQTTTRQITLGAGKPVSIDLRWKA